MKEFMCNLQSVIDHRCNLIGNYPELSQRERVLLNSVALAGETGEVCDNVKKSVWYAEGCDVSLTRSEIRDMMFHVCQLSTELGLELGDILEDLLVFASSDKKGIQPRSS